MSRPMSIDDASASAADLGHVGRTEKHRRNTSTPVSASLRVQRPSFLTVRETAEVLRTSHKAIYAMIERGQLPGVVRLGRRVLINEQVLVDWLSRNTTPSLER